MDVALFRAQGGPLLKRVRESFGYTGKELAEKVSLAPSYLSEIETGKRNLTDLMLDRISPGLGLSGEELKSRMMELWRPTAAEPGTPYSNQEMTPEQARNLVDRIGLLGTRSSTSNYDRLLQLVFESSNDALKSLNVEALMASHSEFLLRLVTEESVEERASLAKTVALVGEELARRSITPGPAEF